MDTNATLQQLNASIVLLQERSVHLENALNVSFLGFAGFLVFFMKAGFALLEAGSVTKKHVLPVVLMNVLDGCIAAILYWWVGFSFAFGDESTPNGFIGSGYYFLRNMPNAKFTMVFWFYQYVFNAVTTTIVSGAIAERFKFQGYLIHAALMSGFIMPVVSHWIWSRNGWLYSGDSDSLFGVGVLDFAGSGVVHLVGGTSSVVAAKMVGYRNQYVKQDEKAKDRKPRFEYVDGKMIVNAMPSSNPIFATLGGLLLWFGWYGFNCGSVILILNNEKIFGRVATNMTISGAIGALVGLYVGRAERRTVTGFKWNLADALNGMLAALVAITGPCAYVEPWAAFTVGFIAALVYKGVAFLYLHPRIMIDDPVDAGPVHGFAGAWGLLAGSLFAKPEYVNEVLGNTVGYGGLFYGGPKRLAAHLVAIGCIATWVAIWTMISFGGMWLIDRLRGDDAWFYELGPDTQELAFGKLQEETHNPTTGFINPSFEMTSWVMEGPADEKKEVGSTNNYHLNEPQDSSGETGKKKIKSRDNSKAKYSSPKYPADSDV